MELLYLFLLFEKLFSNEEIWLWGFYLSFQKISE